MNLNQTTKPVAQSVATKPACELSPKEAALVVGGANVINAAALLKKLSAAAAAAAASRSLI
jgi:hypothetical protein